ncbi:MAG: T9SS type A sorting domain-containing protein [Bacteroidetes bacterium]|nr:T9SS type A sorting domain-containing protein [Bacteroidota bacterium]
MKHIASILFIMTTAVTAQSVTTVIGNSLFNDGLALDAGGNIYAARYPGSTVVKITPQGTLTTFAKGFFDPNGIAFAPNGDLYVPNAAGGTISRVAPDGAVSTAVTITDPSTILFEQDGSMLVAHSTLNKISRIDTAKNVTTLLSSSPLNGPIGLARDTAGLLYIANFTDGKVFRHHGGDSLELIADIPGTLGFLASSRNTLFATGFQQCRIYRISLNGGPVTVLAGNGGFETVDGSFLQASFARPNGIAITPSGDTMYVSDYSSRSLRRLTGFHTVTGNPKRQSIVPAFRLEQNYPNPFNPSTTVSFSVPYRSHVRLEIFSMLSERVARLVDAPMAAGEHSVLFDGSELASGMYLIRMTVGAATITVKAQLIK